MRITFVLLCGMLILQWASAQTRACPEALPSEQFIAKGDFPLIHALAEARTKFNDIDVSPKRLRGRVFGAAGAYQFRRGDGVVRVPDLFIANVTRHIELALDRGYADFIFYPDLGHGHLQLPSAANFQLASNAAFEQLLSFPTLKNLYHTAELFVLKDVNGTLTS